MRPAPIDFSDLPDISLDTALIRPSCSPKSRPAEHDTERLMDIAIPAPYDDAALSRAQFHRRLVIASAIAIMAFFLLFVGSNWHAQFFWVATLLEWAGLALITTAVAGRTWCAMYIGGRKKVDLVVQGPYSLVRHPLYVFSIIGAAGIGALWGSLVVSLVLALITAAILSSIARKEESFMLSTYGKDYEIYKSRVGRFMPGSSRWADADVLLVRPATVVRTFLQSSLFFIGLPAAEFVQWAHGAKVLPTLLLLP
jgi:protein-S-isoprenylcysteine O-methyltransferase Ste14